MSPQNIWSSVECDAWSRDFNYSEYLNLHIAVREEVGAPFSQPGYQALCKVFEDYMEEAH